MKYLVTLLLLTLFAGNASAQITITSSDFLTRGGPSNNSTSYSTSLSQDLPTLQGLVNVTGTNQTWNFNGPTYTTVADTGTATVLVYSTDLPLATDPDFTASTNVIKSVPVDPTQPTIYEFIEVNDAGFWILGVSQDSAGVSSKLLSYTPPMQELKFPLTYGTTWTSSSSFNISSLSQGESLTMSIDAIADGYGTLIVPPSHSSDALRVKVKNTTVISVQGFGITNISYSYNWYTKDPYSANISADPNQQATSGGYSIASGGSLVPPTASSADALNLYLSQNPASFAETKLSYTLKDGGPIQVAIIDPLGRSVRILQDGHASAGQNIIPIDPKAFATGTYFIRVTGDGVTAMRKLVITR